MKLVLMRGTQKGREYPLEEGNNLIGRWDPDAGAFPEVDLEEVDDEAKVSRKHAVIERNGNVLTLEDLGSTNGTYLNRGPRLETGNAVQLKHGDEIVIGKIFLKFEAE